MVEHMLSMQEDLGSIPYTQITPKQRKHETPKNLSDENCREKFLTNTDATSMATLRARSLGRGSCVNARPGGDTELLHVGIRTLDVQCT